MKTTHLSVLILWLASTTPGWSQETVQEKTPPKTSAAPKPSPERDLVNSLIGSWEGVCRTWFTPSKMADESKIKGEIKPVLDGRLIRHTYETTLLGKPRNGEETIVYSGWAKRFQISWLDSFHMRNGILFSEGEVSERGFTVKGSYNALSGPPWVWKTVFEVIDKDHLTITAYNIKPDGPETKVVETSYTRVKP